jgi:phage tail protein X
MSVIYRTKENDMVDSICWDHYGLMDSAVEAVYEANPKLASYGEFLPANIEVLLPNIETNNDRDVVNLWD